MPQNKYWSQLSADSGGGLMQLLFVSPATADDVNLGTIHRLSSLWTRLDLHWIWWIWYVAFAYSNGAVDLSSGKGEGTKHYTLHQILTTMDKKRPGVILRPHFLPINQPTLWKYWRNVCKIKTNTSMGTDLYPRMLILHPHAARYSTNGASLSWRLSLCISTVLWTECRSDFRLGMQAMLGSFSSTYSSVPALADSCDFGNLWEQSSPKCEIYPRQRNP